MATKDTRKVRTPIAQQSTLKRDDRPGYYRRWVSDYPGRIQKFLDAGYTFVRYEDANTETGKAQDPSVMDDSCTRKVVNTHLPEGGGRFGYLMEIPQEWWEEDQQLKEQKRQQIEDEYDPEKHTKNYAYGGVFKNG